MRRASISTRRGAGGVIGRGRSPFRTPRSDTPYRRAARQPLVSVIILSYNYGRYLAQCIESVLAQDYQPLELIVVDDGSTDDSRDVIERYSECVTACFKSNGGEASSMNAGFAASRGAIVVFVDSDDYLLPGAISAHVQALGRPDVVRSQGYLAVLRGERLSGERLPGVTAAEGDLRAHLLERGPGAYVSPPNSGNAWARIFLERVFPLPEAPRTIGGETYLMDTFPLFGSSVTIAKQPTAVYRRHDANTSGVTAELTAENIRTVIAHREARIAWLERIAAAMGHAPSPASWKAGNWRMLTLACLDGRLSGATLPPLWGHLRSAFSAGGLRLRRPVLALALLTIRVAPLPVALGLARRLIELRYM
jgi:hypothetical protein